MLDFYLTLIGSNALKILEKELFKNADVYEMIASDYVADTFSNWELEELAEMIEE